MSNRIKLLISSLTFLIGSLSSNEVIVYSDAEYAAVFCSVTKDHFTRTRKMRMGDQSKHPTDYVLADWFEQTPEASKASNEFEKEKLKEKYIQTVKETSSKINEDSTFVFYVNMLLADYDFGENRFPIAEKYTARSRGSKLTFNSSHNTSGDDPFWVKLDLDQRFSKYIEVPRGEAEKMVKAQTYRTEVRFKFYGKLSPLTKDSPSTLTVSKFDVLDSDGKVVYSKDGLSQRDNCYMLYDYTVEKEEIFYSGKTELFHIQPTKKSFFINNNVSIDGVSTHLGNIKGLKLSSSPTGISIMWYKHSMFGRSKLLVAYLPETEENYKLIASGNEPAIRAAFDKYHKK